MQHLRTRKQFLAVAATRRKWAALGVVLQIKAWDSIECTTLTQTNEGSFRETDQGTKTKQDLFRVGYTASKKVGNAVARNRAKRRLRAAAAAVLPHLGLAHHDYVLIARANTLTRSFQELLGDLTEAVRRVNRPRHSKRNTAFVRNTQKMEQS